MLTRILILFGITLIPAFELRASIPYGILTGSVNLPFGVTVQGMGEPWPIVFLICVASNAMLGIILFPLLDRIVRLLERIPVVERFWIEFMYRLQQKVHTNIEKWGTIGLAIFIAVPLPGSGTYSGALGAYLLGISYRRFIVANIAGVIIAGIIVTAITVSGQGLFKWIF